MARIHSWWGVILLSICIALGLALGLAAVGAGLSLGLAAAGNSSRGEDPSFLGVVTDSLCGPKHQTASNYTSAECTQLCVKKGGQYVLVNGDKVYTLAGNAAYLSQMAGLRLRVWGKLSGNTIQVTHAALEQ